MCNKSESISKIAAALVAFSADVKSISHDAQNQHFKSQYTSLDHMIDETKPILQQHGLTVMQFPGGDGERITLRTMILHESGEWIESEPLTLKPVKLDPQGAGSAITYARRYSYAAALSLSLGDDDDGNGASMQPNQQVQKPSQPRRETQVSPSNEDLAAIERASEDRFPKPASAGSTGGGMKKVFALREQLGMDWKTLNNVASAALGREVKYPIKDYVHSEEEWEVIEAHMISAKAG